MKRMPRGRSQMPFYGHHPCPDNDMPHMQRGPCFTDGYGKMDGPCGMGVGEFKSPMMANPEPPPPPPKKKRRTSNAMAAAAPPPPQSPSMQDLLPPPLTGYGDTIVASNPFDDTPPPTPTMSHMNPMNHVNKHMNVGPCMSPAASMMGSMSPCHIVGSPMNCGPPVGSPINCGPSMGNCSPMPSGGNNPNCGPIGSPHAVCNTRQVSRSPLICPPMSNAGSVMNCGPGSNSPMNVTSVHSMNRSPQSLGSPLSSVMASNVRGNSPLDCGLGLNSIGSQKGSPMSVMNSHNMSSLNCGSPMGSPSNMQMNNCNNGGMSMGSPITSPLGNVPCGMQNGPDLGMNLNSVMNRSPMNAPPSSVGNPMLCNSTMRGQSPLSGGSLGNSPMNMNCNSNPNMGAMGPKSDLNMNEIAAMGRDNCSPGHISMKSNQGPPGCMIPMNNPCSRPSDMNMMQPCGPGQMNNPPHCNPMMNNPGACGPIMNNLPCIGNNMNRPPCGVNPMGMGNPYDGMNPQCRPNMNRSQYPRHMNSMHYGGPPTNSMNSMCGPPPDMNNMPCPPNNQMHCNDQAMSNQQCGANQNMNQCGGNMFNSPFSPFDSRCSPNLPFNEVSMNNGSGFYRNMNQTSQAPCMPNMRNPCNVSSASDLPGPGDMSAIKTESRDHTDLSADISNTVCSLTSSDNNDDLGLMSCSTDNFLKEDRKPKVCNGGLLLDDEAYKLDNVENKLDLDKKDAIVKIKDEKIDGKDDDSVKTMISPTSSGGSQGPTNTETVTSASSTSGTTTSASVTSADSGNDNSTANLTSEGVKNDTEDDLFKSSDRDNSSAGNTNNESEDNRSANETNDKDDSEDKLRCSNENDTSFDDNVNNSQDDKNSSANIESTNATNSNCPKSENAEDHNKENDRSTPIKLENDEFFNGVKNVSDLGPGAPNHPGNNFSNGNVIPTSNFGPGNDVSSVLNNTSSCMTDTMCTTSAMQNMNRTITSNPMNHSMNYPNRPVNVVPPSQMYSPNKTKVYNPQNPNAPPIYACGHCHKEVNDNNQAVLCESGCNFWYHRTCSGLTEPAYRLLTAEIYAEWVCDKCLTTKKIPLVKFKP